MKEKSIFQTLRARGLFFFISNLLDAIPKAFHKLQI